MEQARKVVNIYRKLLRFPEISSAVFSRKKFDCGKIQVQSRWTQHDVERSAKVTFNREYCLHFDKETKQFSVDTISSNTEINNELWNEESPSGNLRAIIRKVKDKKNEDKYYIEIWDKIGKVKTIDPQAKDLHGKIYGNDGQFGELCWSQSEQKILYVAEKKLPKSVSYFVEKKEDQEQGNEHFFKDTWGEQLSEKHKSVLCIVDVESEQIQVLDVEDDAVFPGQPCWSPSEDSVIFVGWKTEPYRLGIIYCPIRDCALYKYDLNTKKTEILSEKGRSVRSLRFSPDGTKLVYLDCNDNGPHMQASRLVMMDWNSRETTIVIDVVKRPENSEFPGLCTFSLPKNCWFTDNMHIVCSSEWRSDCAVIVINVKDKIVNRLTQVNSSFQVLDVFDDKVLLACSSPCVPPYLSVSSLTSLTFDGSLGLQPLEEPLMDLSQISWEVIKLIPTEDRAHPSYGLLDYECILCMPMTSGNKPPFIVFPHGGPHTVFTTSYSMYVAGFCEAGFAVALVNYRGSFGFGDDSLRSLPGHVGDMDVKDCQAAALHVVKEKNVDATRVAVFGGSHGGFLTLHLIGQYPEFYKAACCRNPVTNLCNMYGVTDIPDWVYVESGLDFSHSSVADEKCLTEMFLKSPIKYIDKVKTPLQLMLGTDDRRCPKKQAEHYYKALKSRGVPTRLICYEENEHPIITPEAQADAFVNIILWFYEHMGIEG